MESLKNTFIEEEAAPPGQGPVMKSSSSDRMRAKQNNRMADELMQRKSKSTTPPVPPSRRGSVAAGGRGGSTKVESTGYRRGSTIPSDFSTGGRRGSYFPAEGVKERRGSCFGGDTRQQGPRGSRLDHDGGLPTQRKKKKAPEPEPALTKEQVEAFQEVFNLFDSNGGGTIDADELHLVLSSVDIHLPAQEIRDVLEKLDKDGSGEIDFEEFLTLMTNTEKFLETVVDSHDEHPEGEDEKVGGRETVLFDALTKFMKTSALKQIDVLERYFNTKYKKAQAPHVVMHYAAGARLIGLTEKQLVQHLDRLQESNEEYDYKSPYAKPLRIMLTPQRKKKTKKKKKTPAAAATEEPIAEERPRLTGKIRIRFLFKSENENRDPPVEENKKEAECVNHVIEEKTKKEKAATKPRLGWMRPQVKGIAQRLPKMRITPDMDNLATIREKIQVATTDYYHDQALSRQQDNRRYWKTLKCHRMNTTQRASFKRVFHAYSDAGRVVVV